MNSFYDGNIISGKRGQGKLELKDWYEKSQKGELCGIFGCYEEPTSQCPICNNHYCYIHIWYHMHLTKEKKKEVVKN